MIDTIIAFFSNQIVIGIISGALGGAGAVWLLKHTKELLIKLGFHGIKIKGKYATSSQIHSGNAYFDTSDTNTTNTTTILVNIYNSNDNAIYIEEVGINMQSNGYRHVICDPFNLSQKTCPCLLNPNETISAYGVVPSGTEVFNIYIKYNGGRIVIHKQKMQF